MISLDLNQKNKVKQIINLKKRTQNNYKITNKIRNKLKIKIANKKTKSQNQQLKKTLRKIMKVKTNQIITVYRKEGFKNSTKIKIQNKINFLILILKVQNHLKYIQIGKLKINLEHKGYLKIQKNKKEKRTLKIIFQIIFNKNKVLYLKEAQKITKKNFSLNLINPTVTQLIFVQKNK